MAETKLTVSTEGFRELVGFLDEIITKGATVEEAIKKTNEVSNKQAKEMIDAQNQMGASLAETAESYEELGAISKFALDQVRKLQGQVRKDVEEVTSAIEQGNIEQAEGLKIIKRLAKEYGELEKEVKDLEDGLKKSALQQKNLTTQIREAQKEAELAGEKFGVFSPEFKAAAERAAELKKEMQFVKDSIDQLNPEKKLQAIGNLATSIAGGFAAVQGILALTGDTSDQTSQKLLKVQAALTAVQGLQAFFSSFSQTVRGLAGWLTTATVASEGYAGAQALTAGATVTTTGATVAQTGATIGLSAAIQVLTRAMLANPILSAAAVLLGIGAAIVALSDDSESAKDKVDDLVDSLERLQDVREILRQRQKTEIDFQREYQDLIAGDLTLSEQLTIAEERRAEDAAINAKKVNEIRSDEAQQFRTLVDVAVESNEDLRRSALTLKETLETAGDDVKAKLDALAQFQKDARDELSGEELTAVDTLITGLREKIKAEEGALNERAQLNLAYFIERAGLIEEDAAKEEADREKRLKAEQAALKERLKLVEDFNRAAAALAEKALSGSRAEDIAALEVLADRAAKGEQLAEERKYREEILDIREEQERETIDILERGLQERLAKIALEKKIGIAALKELSDEQLQARLDALIEQGQANLPAEQLEALEALRAQIAARYQRQRTQVAVDESEKRIDQDRKEVTTSLNLLAQRQDLVTAQLDNAEGNAAEINRILADAGIEQVKGITTVEQAKLAVVIDYAKRRIAILEATGNLEDQVLAERLKKLVADTQAELQASQRFSLQDLLGLGDDDMAVLEQAFAQVGQFAQQALANYFIGLQQENALIRQQLEDRIALTQSAIQREQAAREEGLANNLDAELRTLDQLQKQKEQAQKDAELIAKKQRAAQLVIQGANLVTAITGLISNEALKGGVLGLGIAAAAIPFLLALFNNARSKVVGVVGQFYEGTPYLERNGAPKGRDTIPIMAHEGERIVKTDENLRRWDAYEGMRTGNKDQALRGFLQVADEMDFLDRMRSILSEDPIQVLLPPRGLPGRLSKAARDAEDARFARTVNPKIEAHLESIAMSNAKILRREMEKETRTYAPDGTLVIEQGGNIKIIKPTPKI